MEFKIYFSNKSKNQMFSTLDYLKNNLMNENASKKLGGLIKDCLLRIKENPYQFPPLENKFLETNEYREAHLIKMHYKFIFKIENNKVFILGFFNDLEDFISKIY